MSSYFPPLDAATSEAAEIIAEGVRERRRAVMRAGGVTYYAREASITIGGAPVQPQREILGVTRREPTPPTIEVSISGRSIDPVADSIGAMLSRVTATTDVQRAEAWRRAEWWERVLVSLARRALRWCAACGTVDAVGVLCAKCSGYTHHATPESRLRITPAAAAAWRERIYTRQRAAAPVPLDLPGGACVSRLYSAAPPAPDAVRLRCPLRSSPDGASDVCASAPSARCAVP